MFDCRLFGVSSVVVVVFGVFIAGKKSAIKTPNTTTTTEETHSQMPQQEVESFEGLLQSLELKFCRLKFGIFRVAN